MQHAVLAADRADVIRAVCQCMSDADIEGRKALLGALQQPSGCNACEAVKIEKWWSSVGWIFRVSYQIKTIPSIPSCILVRSCPEDVLICTVHGTHSTKVGTKRRAVIAALSDFYIGQICMVPTWLPFGDESLTICLPGDQRALEEIVRCTWREDAEMYVFSLCVACSSRLVPLLQGDWRTQAWKYGRPPYECLSASCKHFKASNAFFSDSGRLMMFELHPESMSRSAAPLFPGLEWSQKMQDFRMCMGCFQRVWRTLTVLASVVRMSSHLGSYTKVVWPLAWFFGVSGGSTFQDPRESVRKAAINAVEKIAIKDVSLKGCLTEFF